MNAQDVKLFFRAFRNKPQKQVENAGDNAPVGSRGNGYGDLSVQNLTNSHHALGDEGSYFVLGTPTPGTGVLIPVTSGGFVDTTPALIITNGDNIGGERVFLDYIKLILKIAGGGAPTDLQYAIYLDNASRIGLNPGGTQLIPSNVNSDVSNSSVLSKTVFFGANTVLARTQGARLIGSGVLRSIASVVNDHFYFLFGGIEKNVNSQNFALATAAALVAVSGPAILGPGGAQALFLHLWSTGETTTGKNMTCEIGEWER